jgi:hypothetical protein
MKNNTIINGECSHSCPNTIDTHPCYGRGMIRKTRTNEWFVQCNTCGWITNLESKRDYAITHWENHRDRIKNPLRGSYTLGSY